MELHCLFLVYLERHAYWNFNLNTNTGARKSIEFFNILTLMLSKPVDFYFVDFWL